MRSREQRLGQSLGNEDLSGFIGTARYTSATLTLTGEDKDSDVTPNNPLFGAGMGVVEVGVRYDSLTFESASKEGPRLHQPPRQTSHAQHRQHPHVLRQLDANPLGQDRR
jgi:hypothetical protein